MPQIAQAVMHALYGTDIWANYQRGDAPPDLQGWAGNHPSLGMLASQPGAKIVVDVGVWKGQSTINMAGAMKAAGIDGCIVAVDTFLGSPEHWWMGGDLFNRVMGRPDIYDRFLRNVYDAGLTDYVVPMPQTSVTAAYVLKRHNITPAVVHVDAAHEYADVIRDVENYWEILSVGGYMIGDDYDHVWPGVVRAAGEFSARVNRPLNIQPPKWILQKTEP
jgi:hypothetical protein